MNRPALLAAAVLAALVAFLLLRPGDTGPVGAPAAHDAAGRAAAPVLVASPTSKAPPRPATEARESSAAGAEAAYALWVFVEDARAQRVPAGVRVALTLSDGAVREQSTDARGTVQFAGLTVAPRSVLASAPDYETGVALWLRREARDQRLHVVLLPTAGRDVQVVSQASGRPVAGAQVRLLALSPVRFSKSPIQVEGEFEVGETDARGLVHLPVESATERSRVGDPHSYLLPSWLLDVRATGYRRTWWAVRADTAVGDGPQVVRLSPGTDLVGTATDEQGRPLADVQIVAVASRGGGRSLDGVWPWPDGHMLDDHDATETQWIVPQRAASDAQGRYRVQGVGLGEAYVVEASLAGHASADAPALRAAADGGEMRWDPVLPRGARLEVRVVDSDGRPIPHVYGSASRKAPSYGAGGNGTTDEDGLLTFADLGAGTYDVGLQPKAGPGTPMNQYGQAAYDCEKGWNLVVEQGRVTRVTLVLPRGSHGADPPTPHQDVRLTITGRVVTASGAPLPHLVVRDRLSSPVTVTDDEGRFEAQVSPHERLTLGGQGPWATGETFAPPSDGSPLVIVARPARRTTVQVVVEVPVDAPPPEAVTWTLTPSQRGLPAGWTALPAHHATAPWPSRETRRVVLEAQAPPGTLELRVAAAGFEQHVSDREISAGAALSEMRVTLARGRVGRGRVLDEGGQPVAGAHVRAWGSKHGMIEALTGPDGRFEISPLEPEPVHYWVSAPGRLPVYGSPSDAPEAGDFDAFWGRRTRLDPARIVLVRAAYVEVTVVDAAGRRQGGVTVSLASGGTQDGGGDDRPPGVGGFTGLDGTVTLEVLAGPWSVELPSGYSGVPSLLSPAAVEAVAGETVQVRLVVPTR